MCDPATMVIAASAVAAASQVYSGFQQAGQARYAAGIADQNQRIAAQQAQDSENNTALEAQRRYRMLAQTKGAQEAALAANGVDLNFGTALDLQRDTAMIGAEDIGQIYKSGAERTRGLDIEGWNYGAEAKALRSKASGAIVGGFLNAAGTALGGASQVSKLKSAAGMGSSVTRSASSGATRLAGAFG